MKIPTVLALIFAGVFCTHCHYVHKDSFEDSPKTRKFTIQEFDNYKILEIVDPWQNAHNEDFRYILSDDFAFVPDSLLKFTCIKTPVKSVVVFSTTHIGFLTALNESKSLVGASGASYIYNKDLKIRYKKGEIKEIGYPPSINYESIIELNPDVIFIYGLESSVTGIISRLETAGIPCVIIGDYLENHPLGKAEWIRVFSAFYNKLNSADSIYKSIEKQYNELSELVKDNQLPQPSVMLGLPWKDSWYMAGGKSYAAKLIEDAGGHYLWSETDETDYHPLSIESVIQKALYADLWINPGSARSLDDIISRDKRYGVFHSYKNHSLYNNDNRFDGNSNDYWETGVIEPHIILKDLIKIIHPQELPEYELVYYRRLL